MTSAIPVLSALPTELTIELPTELTVLNHLQDNQWPNWPIAMTTRTVAT